MKHEFFDQFMHVPVLCHCLVSSALVDHLVQLNELLNTYMHYNLQHRTTKEFNVGQSVIKCACSAFEESWQGRIHNSQFTVCAHPDQVSQLSILGGGESIHNSQCMRILPRFHNLRVHINCESSLPLQDSVRN